MNGRIYDPLLGRMLSADLIVQNPGSLQDYNRYSYVRNSPLSLVDPSGWQAAPPPMFVQNMQAAFAAGHGREFIATQNAMGPSAARAIGMAGVGVAPYLGDGVGLKMNVDTLRDSNAPTWEKGLAIADTGLTFYSAGLLPNLMPLRRAVGELMDAAKAAENTASGAARGVDNAAGATRSLDIPDAPKSIATGGELSNPSANTGAPDFVFRGDTRSSETIFNEGFTAKGSNSDLLAHTLGEPTPPSGFVSTSTSSEVAESFANNVYIVRNEGGIDVNAALGSMSPHRGELEVAFKGKIEPVDIRAMTDTQRGLSILNPNWRK